MKESETISQVRNEFVDAFNRADIERMTALITDDMVGMPPNQLPVIGKDATRSWWNEGFSAGRSRLTVSPQELEVAGDWAFDRFTWVMETTPTGGGTSAIDKGKCVWILRRQHDGSWKLARAIWNSDMPVPSTVWSGASRSTT